MLDETRHDPRPGYSRNPATILFADIRGFSVLWAAHPVERVLEVLNRCFATMTDIIAAGSGTIDKFTGDGVMAVFHEGPGPDSEHARAAVRCAVEMQIAMQALRAAHIAEKLPQLYLGIGISTGMVVGGMIGSSAYRVRTVFGDEVNIASRLEALSLRGQILVSDATWTHVAGFAQAGEPVDVYVKGRAERVQVREVLGIPGLGKALPRQDQRKSPRASVRLALDYWAVSSKIVGAQTARGTVLDIGYYGMLAELAEPVARFAEIKLAFDLPPLGLRAAEVFARVVSVRTEDGRVLAGLEFTSVDTATDAGIRLFVQMLLQGDYRGPR